MKRLLILIVLIAGAGGGGWYYWRQSNQETSSFRTASIRRGELLITISATGTVEPVEVIDVGAQVAGRILAFGTDPHAAGQVIDYGSQVDEGTILAQIDDSIYASEMARAAAEVEQAKANVLRAQADVAQMRAKLREAEQNWERAKQLGPSRALSASDFDAYQAAFETAKATVAVGEATIVQTEKSVAQSEASLKRAQTNLGYCTIRSPVKGVIIDRRVNIGQTVVASLNAPSLFLIAKDLRKMQVWAAVNESDIGSVRPGQPVSFTVDAFPGRTFRGEVGKIRLNASMTQNVVTYTVEINTDNSDGRLLPYLTATVRFEVARHPNVLMAPNAALRFVPTAEKIAPGADPEAFERRGGSQPASDPDERHEDRNSAAMKEKIVWILQGGYAQPIPVLAGLSDGTMTEIEGEGVAEGMDVIVAENENAEDGIAGDGTSPFAPRMFRRSGR